MPIELRILSGARAGQTQTFEKSVIAIGRHPSSDLAFDIKRDLDVSANHGEIRTVDGQYAIYDKHSTNGTYVNGSQVPAGETRFLRTGDTVAFGAHGPTVSVNIADDVIPPRTSVHALPAGGAKPRSETGERIAIAVKHQTRRIRLAAISAVVILSGVAGGAVWMERRDAAKRDEEIKQLLATIDQTSKTFQEKLSGMSDTTLANSWKRRADSLASLARDARGESAQAAAYNALKREGELQKKVSAMDAQALFAANNGAVVLINAEIGAERQEATGFAVSTAGLIVTNQHVVEDSTGARATRIHVKYANSQAWYPAHVVKIAATKAIDLALIQLDSPGRRPMVALARSVDVPVGSPAITIGFPDGTSLPMDGAGNDAAAKPTLTMGMVSKSLADVLQLDSFATHGSSGSPVFDAHGHVVGVVWGGPPGVNGRIVFAVPAEKIAELVNGVK